MQKAGCSKDLICEIVFEPVASGKPYLWPHFVDALGPLGAQVVEEGNIFEESLDILVDEFLGDELAKVDPIALAECEACSPKARKWMVDHGLLITRAFSMNKIILANHYVLMNRAAKKLSEMDSEDDVDEASEDEDQGVEASANESEKDDDEGTESEDHDQDDEADDDESEGDQDVDARDSEVDDED